MKYQISEMLGQSIMTKAPSIIVEGIDDVKVYDSIVKSIGTNHYIIPVECIDGFSEGNEQVIRAMNAIKEFPASKYDYKNYILGIIDKDVRDYRNEIPENDLVFPLNVYSIESHFVNEENILSSVREITRITSDLDLRSLEEIIITEILSKFEMLYLFSLDALKGSLDSTYSSSFSYSFNEGRTIEQADIDKILLIKESLLSFATSKGITYDLETLKKISKGKWILFLYCYYLEKVVRKLPQYCREHKINTCRICLTDVEKCLYKIKEGFSHKTIKSLILNRVDINELSYIKDKFSSMQP